ncbi:hypothetical protein IscW_ISCW011443 [Ixodes scapularis]|uniref:Uncharacterized protein n=1 Tax=Ixodes scapularis TaxID=6945 RepID=B7Q9I2_IXOSC|nr:hypothetical protein IscW_ISCW011443 [Ixodes scapularis]|eukprot:XP_002412496.1 hypothetical protein IscW_ISCW011443 [Ixodes scapularis]
MIFSQEVSHYSASRFLPCSDAPIKTGPAGGSSHKVSLGLSSSSMTLMYATVTVFALWGLLFYAFLIVWGPSAFERTYGP